MGLHCKSTTNCQLTVRPTMMDIVTVKFNVGGKHFEVSRDLIEQHPDTMLAKLVSETWESEPENALFIDRDGDKFAHVLDYLRYGSIELPATIPRSMFERELDYYGIISAKDSITKSLTLAELSEKYEREGKIFTLAFECFAQFHRGNTFFFIEQDHELYDVFGWNRALTSQQFAKLNSFLGDHYGLKAEMGSRSVYQKSGTRVTKYGFTVFKI